MLMPPFCSSFFFFNDTATTEIYTLSLHDALPIFGLARLGQRADVAVGADQFDLARRALQHHRDDPLARGCLASPQDRKSTRLNSSHQIISYAAFCFKKKKVSTTQNYHNPPL